MKNTARTSTIVAALAVVVLTAVVSFAQPKGATVTIKGEAVDLWCYMEGGDLREVGEVIGHVRLKGQTSLGDAQCPQDPPLPRAVGDELQLILGTFTPGDRAESTGGSILPDTKVRIGSGVHR